MARTVRAKILCVEDEPELREQIVEELSDAGYAVFEAGDGKQGLAAILEHKPNLVLSDVNMPGITGGELMEKVRTEHPEFAEMPFIFLTAQADRTHRIEAKRQGADDYLTKPVDFELLLACVEAQLAQIERVNSHKEKQMLKLYQALNTEESDAEDKTKTDERPSVVAENPLRVMIAGYDECFLVLMKKTFEDAGHQCFTTRSGRKVIDKHAELKADVVILTENTKDLAAPLVVKMLATGDQPVPRIVLLIDSNRDLVIDEFIQRLSAKIIPIPCPPEQILETAVSLVG